MGKRDTATAAFAVLMIPISSVSVAQIAGAPYRWCNVTVGGGGFAPGIVFSTAERGLAYLRTDMGGAYRFDAATGRWVPLQDGNPVSSYMGVESVAADPRRVYLAVGMSWRGQAAILRSTDRGANWAVTPVPFKMGGNEDGRGLGERLAIDPTAQTAIDIPRVVTKNGRHALIVDGAPFLMLGAQVNNSSNYASALPQVWPMLDRIHANTVEIPIAWQQVEPVEGQFDLSFLQTLLDQARARMTNASCCFGSARGRTLPGITRRTG